MNLKERNLEERQKSFRMIFERALIIPGITSGIGTQGGLILSGGTEV